MRSFRSKLMLILAAVVGSFFIRAIRGPFFIWSLGAEEAGVKALAPQGESVAGWPMVEEVRTFSGEELFDFINGAAEPFFTYGFVCVATADYQNKDGQLLSVEIYEMDSSANAFGIYSFQRPFPGEKVEIGADCVMAESILHCWKDRYYIRVHTFPDSPAARDAVRAFAKSIAKNIKEEGSPPALLKVLPRDHLIPGSEKFLHQKKVLDNIYFLSKENVLKLSKETNMVLADYKMDEDKITLFVVEYLDDEKCKLASESYAKFIDSPAAARMKSAHWMTSDNLLVGAWGKSKDKVVQLTKLAYGNTEDFLKLKKK